MLQQKLDYGLNINRLDERKILDSDEINSGSNERLDTGEFPEPSST
jgi:hypothetical protein